VERNEITNLKVWIDQDLCTGDGLCAEIAPSVFQMHDDGLAYVKEQNWPTIYGPDGSPKGEPALKMGEGLASVMSEDVEATIESAEECPGECIFIELVD
jgi:ferredoxin